MPHRNVEGRCGEESEIAVERTALPRRQPVCRNTRCLAATSSASPQHHTTSPQKKRGRGGENDFTATSSSLPQCHLTCRNLTLFTATSKSSERPWLGNGGVRLWSGLPDYGGEKQSTSPAGKASGGSGEGSPQHGFSTGVPGATGSRPVTTVILASSPAGRKPRQRAELAR